MSKQVTVEELREKLDELLAEVEKGETLTVVSANSRNAVGPTIVQKGTRYPFRDFDFGSRPKNLKLDGAEVIIAERERERSGLKYKL